MKADGITLLAMARDGELKPKTILKTEHEKQYFDDRDYDYYIYFGENQFHRCNEDGILGSKYQNRFLNYEVLKKKFELIEPTEEKEIEEIDETLEYLSHNFQESVLLDIRVIQGKINELVREVNKIKGKNDNDK